MEKKERPSMSIKKSIIAASILIPIGGLIFFALVPAADPTFEAPVFHFHIVTFFTFAAVVAAYLVGLVLGQDSAPRHRLLATAFVVMGSLFFIHGILTPNVITTELNPGIRWASWFTFSIGGLIFLIAAQDRPGRPLSPDRVRSTHVAAGVFTAVFALIVFFRPSWLQAIDNVANPWHALVAFLFTFTIWSAAAYALWQVWRHTQDQVDAVMVLISVWLAIGTVSMHLFDLWLLSWWLYHLLLLMGAITAVAVLIQSYEQLRRFRLTYYYLAIGLIATAALALWASHLVAEFVQKGIYREVEAILMQTGILPTELPDMTQMVINARITGLWASGLAMGTLFGALMVIVNRADRLILRRTNELAQANVELKAAEALRDDLTDMIVHDLRTPLTTLNLSLDLLERTLQDESKVAQRQRFVQAANRSAVDLLQLVNQLLDVAQLEAGQLRLNPSENSLVELLQEKAAVFQPQIVSSQKHLTLALPENLPPVVIDADLIDRVLDNLLSNALKYTESGGQITLRAQQIGNKLMVAVADDGEGIDPSVSSQIFDKFYQVRDGNGKPLRQGTGLGLSFCKMVVEAHNGRIWVESQPGEGSTFYFTLPFAQNGLSPNLQANGDDPKRTAATKTPRRTTKK
ncbi:sensor histidine kinase [Candidatus Leptofilum sp.]|uniref:sensor histidine kinase n=1 Tax=Candidatus Leptofilum sp. TaxID=3241576 RepID=UPI003B598611